MRRFDIDISDEAVEAAQAGVLSRLTWASMHWGTESVSPDAWPHIARAALTSAAPLMLAEQAEAIAVAIEDYADSVYDLIDSPNGARLAFEKITAIARTFGGAA